MKLKYNKEASIWTEALPVANGLTGIMSYGSITNERLAVNNCTLWSGYPISQDNPDSLTYLQEVRKLINDGKYHKADKLAESKLSGGYSQSFMPLGDVFIKFTGINEKNYLRWLDLDNAISYVKTDTFSGELFANYPSDVVCYKLENTTKFSCEITLSSKLKSKTIGSEYLSLVGQAPDNVVPNYVIKCLKPIVYDKNLGMAFCLSVKIDTDGMLSIDNEKATITNATKVILYLATATGFNGYDKMPTTDLALVNKIADSKLKNVSYSDLKAEHIADYTSIYNKSKFSLYSSSESLTDELLKNIEVNNIPSELIELFYDYGKYLMIAGSRRGGEALNLQGIWNEDIRPAWSSNYTVNINTEMNYWPVSRCNLIECIEPFFRLVKELSITGKATAKTNYGTNGFCCNHNTDIWRKTSPVIGSCNYMLAPLCGVWLVNELYGHYKNAELTSIKEDVFEIVKQACIFVSEFLVFDNGYYIINPSTSPEAQFKDKFSFCSLSKGTAFDMGLVNQLFTNYLDMDSNSNFAKDIKEKKEKLYPIKQGKLGIQEFYLDKMIVDKGHRHFSPLYSLYPAKQIQYYKDSKLVESAKKLFNSRLSHSKNQIGWSAGWGICLASNLRDKQQCENIVYSLFKNSVFTNLFDAHFPNIFQIDGNFGFVAGVNEMLVYEENGVIELLPNLINNMSYGYITGLVVNGAEISFTFKDNKVVSISSTKPIKLLNKNISNVAEIHKNITLVGGVY